MAASLQFSINLFPSVAITIEVSEVSPRQKVLLISCKMGSSELAETQKQTLKFRTSLFPRALFDSWRPLLIKKGAFDLKVIETTAQERTRACGRFCHWYPFVNACVCACAHAHAHSQLLLLWFLWKLRQSPVAEASAAAARPHSAPQPQTLESNQNDSDSFQCNLTPISPLIYIHPRSHVARMSPLISKFHRTSDAISPPVWGGRPSPGWH